VTEIAITRAGAERIDDVEPLWHAMHRHHRSVALARPDSFFLLAERDGSLVGYAAVGVSGTEATLEVGERVGELESLSVLPVERGNGLGGRLMDAVFEELRRLGSRRSPSPSWKERRRHALLRAARARPVSQAHDRAGSAGSVSTTCSRAS
jgi:GNAT superfamily N-acetyltransferase